MPNEDRLQTLADQLAAGTREKRLSWSVASPDTYQLSLPHGVIVTGTDDGGYPFMNVFDDNGNFIESLEETQSPKPWDSSLRTLFEVARNSALNVDVILDSIAKDVESAAPPAADDIPF